MQIDSFLKNSFTLVTKVLSNPNFEQNYEIFQSMNPKTVEFAANELRFDIQLVTNPYFSQVVSQAKNSEVLKECLAQRAIELGLVDKLYRDLGVNASSRKCSFGFVAWNVGVSALEIAAGCEIVVVCPLALANAAERAYNIFCCWHCG